MDSFIRFEHRRQPVVPRRMFLHRLGRNLSVAVTVVGVSLFVGMVGYVWLEGRSWIEAYDYAAMILSGMGPFDVAKTDAGRIFEGTYALYSGLMLVALATLILVPVFHRVLHSFHVEDEADEKRDERPPAQRSKRARN